MSGLRLDATRRARVLSQGVPLTGARTREKGLATSLQKVSSFRFQFATPYLRWTCKTQNELGVQNEPAFAGSLCVRPRASSFCPEARHE